MDIKVVTLYYDKNEKEGFYPITYPIDGYESIDIEFEFKDSCWQQISGNPIDEFDYIERKNILNILNDETHNAKNIFDLLGYLI